MAGRGVWRRGVAARAAEEFGGVVSRSVLRQHAVTHDDVRSEVRAHRWTALGRHTVFLGDLAAAGVDPVCGPDGPVARAWWAVWESGSGAMLDGVSALIAAGMTGFTTDAVHVSLSTSSAFYPLPRVVPHWPTRRIRQPGGGLPRTVPELATLHAATWAVSDRQAALLVAMPVQQRLVNAPRLLELWRTVRRSDRRELLDGIIGDVCDGAHSLGELDVAGLCRRYGLPQPTRQAVRTERKGRVYLDVFWKEFGVAAEVEGAHHTQGLNAVDDAVRQNEVSIVGDVVIRIPVLGLRLDPETFMAQLARALQAAAGRRGRPLAAGAAAGEAATGETATGG